ncbi:hypothetical protein QTO30_21365 [Yoonia sp. GPGPB17]|uniref:hypothetical protein n=1 Tax=Yoonia sp. GPGPB17 TaxID=3026147 RepID=UPI0030BF6137
MSLVPTSYEDWKHCITIKCGIPLTSDYVAERLTALHDHTDYQTEKFINRWGAAHHARTLAWFEQAAKELSQD